LSEPLVAGWDLGGAHLKVARVDAGPRIGDALQVPCGLWRGLDELDRALASASQRIGPVARHAVTMTGELVDLFANRAEGVARLIGAMTARFPEAELRVYAGRAGLLPPEAALARPLEVASANWLASAEYAARRLGEGLLLDIGSTTTDLVPFAGGAVRARGMTDAERLETDELVYTGVTRTPVMAVAERVCFGGARQGLMAELFATMADVHRLTGDLPADADQHETADGRDKSEAASARRLARMLGRDVEEADLAIWRQVAAELARCQQAKIEAAVARVLSRGDLGAEAPLVGAGIGRFLVRRIADGLERTYTDFAALIEGSEDVKESAARCAPAAAVALLAAEAV